MLDPEYRFFATSADIDVGGPSVWHIVDWDQRRFISVKMKEELESEEPAVEHLRKHIDTLASNVVEIEVSSQGDLLATSSDPEKDKTSCMIYPPVATAQPSESIHVVSRQDLEELDRLGPLVDLVVVRNSSEPKKKLVFKYYFLDQRMRFVWHEMSLWMRLPPHPNIVPFDKIVIDEVHGGCVGFTVPYIPGGTLEENRSRIFKLKWLRQLTEVIDELNYQHGITHQDVAPRNLIIDEATDSLMIFDFNSSAQIGRGWREESRNDVKGVLFTIYELITRDEALQTKILEELDILDIEGEWIQHHDVQLDHPVSEFRQALQEWCEKRQARGQINNYKDAPEFIDWPDMPKGPPSGDMIRIVDGAEVHLSFSWSRKKRDLIKKGEAFLNWQRPSQSNLQSGGCLLETGEYIPHVEPGKRDTHVEDDAEDRKTQPGGDIGEKTHINRSAGEREDLNRGRSQVKGKAGERRTHSRGEARENET